MGLPSIKLPWSKSSREAGAGGGALSKLASAISASKAASARVATGSGFPIAIDFGTGSLKVLQLEEGDPPRMGTAVQLDTPMPLVSNAAKRFEFQVEALTQLVKKVGFKGRRAVCSIPAHLTVLKHMQLPRSENVSTKQLVEAAIPAQFNCDPRNLVYRFFEVPSDNKNDKRVDVIIIAVTREQVARLMDALVVAKLEPVGIHSEWVCALRAFDHLHRRDVDIQLNTLYLDIGTSSSRVMIAHGTSLAFARNIPVGGYKFDQTVAHQLSLDESAARAKRLEAALPIERSASDQPNQPLDPSLDRRTGLVPQELSSDVLSMPGSDLGPVGADLSTPLEVLTDELRLCMRYHASQFPGRRVDRMVCVGGEARARGLVQRIAQALRIPAQVADPMARIARTGSEPIVGVDFKQPQPGWTVVLGLSLSPTDL
jgi:type IV pilus assembly protein PilM